MLRMHVLPSTDENEVLLVLAVKEKLPALAFEVVELDGQCCYRMKW